MKISTFALNVLSATSALTVTLTSLSVSAHYCYDLPRQWEVQCQPVASSLDPKNLSNALTFSGFNQVRRDVAACMDKAPTANGYRSDLFLNTFNDFLNRELKAVLPRPLSYVENTEDLAGVLSGDIFTHSPSLK